MMRRVNGYLQIEPSLQFINFIVAKDAAVMYT